MASDTGLLSTATDDLIAYMWRWVWPLLCVTGLVGNSLVLLVLRRDGLLGTSANVYLTALAVGDSLELTVASVAAYPIYAWSFCVEDTSMWTCRAIWSVHHTLGNASIWFIVAFTAERCVAVCFPLFKLILCTPRKASVCCVALLVVAFVKNIDLVFVVIPLTNTTSGDVACFVPLHGVDGMDDYRPWINIVFTTTVPICIVLVCNFAITRQLRRTLMPTTARNSAARTTFMCLGVSLAFVVCVVPHNVFVVFGRNWPMTQPTRKIVFHSVILLRYVNHAINLFLYSMTGAHFRSELVALFRSCTQRRRAEAAVVHRLPSRVAGWFESRRGYGDDLEMREL